MRYLLFAGYTYYPSGGWGDYRGSFETVEEAVARFEKDKKENWWDWYHIVDSQTLMEVS